MKCAKCGEPLVPGANFCQYCGAAVEAKPAEPEAKPAAEGGSETKIEVGQVDQGQVIGRVETHGDQPVHLGGEQHYGDAVQGDKIDTGGGAYFREAIHTGGGDFVLGQKIEGDLVQGDKIAGDKISVTGDHARVEVSHGLDAAALAELFQAVNRRIAGLPERPEIGQDELKDTARRVEQEIARGDQANPDRLKRWLEVLEKYAPEAVEMVVNALLNPGAGAASVVKAVLRQFGSRRKAG
jgi:hypothetical protein